MKSLAKVLFVFAFGCVIAWVLLSGFCSLPDIRYSNVCGHNAYVWLPLALPVGIALSWVLASWLPKRLGKQTMRDRASDNDDA